MTKKKILIVYWAGTLLNFVNELSDRAKLQGINIELIRVSHHHTWFKKRNVRSFIINFFYLSTVFIKILSTRHNITVIFGINAVRILTLFLISKSKYLVFNELPVLNKSKLLFFYDKYIFKNFKNCYVSSELRKDLVLRSYDIFTNLGVLSNIPSLPEFPVQEKREDIMYAGHINSQRMDADFEKLKSFSHQIGGKIHLYGHKSYEDFDKDIFDYKGQLDHLSMIKKMSDYNYGLLMYPQENLNNEFCTPIKIYEYLAYGCKPVSVKRNKGLLWFEENYPGTILFLDENTKYRSDDVNLNIESAQRCLEDARKDNELFVNEILSNLKN